ncbi:MAG TPA: hypothetical protein VFA74_18995 [Terriglobales bacterium]|nr:hypothetical protein [Terriglobales bacterium]
MVSEKAIYWIAAVVMVFGFSHTRFDSHFDWTSRVGSRLACVVDRVSGQTDRLLAKAELPMELGEARIDRGQADMARVQQKLACMQSMMARRQADFARLEANRARFVAMEQAQRIRFVSPMHNVVINVPKVNVTVPRIIVDDNSL